MPPLPHPIEQGARARGRLAGLRPDACALAARSRVADAAGRDEGRKR